LQNTKFVCKLQFWY